MLHSRSPPRPFIISFTVYPLLGIRIDCLYARLPSWQWCRFRRNSVRCRYNEVNFRPNSHKMHTIARPLGWVMGYNLWFDTLIYIVLQSTGCCMKHLVILDRVITALDCANSTWGGYCYTNFLCSVVFPNFSTGKTHVNSLRPSAAYMRR